ncbi:MAG: redoxin domain-containing protein [Angustibacter sp.]
MRRLPRPTRRARARVAAFALSALVLAGCSTGTSTTASDAPGTETGTSSASATRSTEPAATKSGAAASGPLSFTATTLSGPTLDVATLAGKPVVLWFWAPWCTICRGEAPEVAAAAADLAGEATVLGVPGLGGQAEMRAFVESTGTGGFQHLVDADGTVWRRFGITSQPSFVFVSADGRTERVVGALDGDAVRARVAALRS